jgi:DNA invertase Pin-like site-specific DNA recombinase
MMVAAAKGGQRVGYIRVSSTDQNTERQLDGVQVDERFEDKASGKDVHRPALQRALKHLRRGDVLVTHSMDRLARSLSDLLALVKELTKRGVAVEFVKENLVFTGDDSPMSKLMLSVMGATAEFERDMIRERQREGIAAAKAKGKHLGRVAKLEPRQVKELQKRVKAGEDKAEIAAAFGISRGSVYNYAAAAGGR